MAYRLGKWTIKQSTTVPSPGQQKLSEIGGVI